jgi:hypothetical protein
VLAALDESRERVSLDHLVGTQQQRRRQINADCLRSLEVDNELELSRLEHR